MFGFLEFEGNKMEKKCIRKKLKFIQIFSLLVAHVAVDFSSQNTILLMGSRSRKLMFNSLNFKKLIKISPHHS